MLDFSPTVALLALVALSSIVSSTMQVGRITVGGIIALILSLAWGCVQSVLGLIILILAIRLIALAVSRNYSSAFWDVLDRTITPLIYRISGTFSNSTLPFKTAIIISLISLILFTVGGRVIIALLIRIVQNIPF